MRERLREIRELCHLMRRMRKMNRRIAIGLDQDQGARRNHMDKDKLIDRIISKDRNILIVDNIAASR